jgi:maltooligosyltrehalose trehalohydrolase
LFLQNHDQVGNRAFGERLVNIADTDALKAATVLLLLCPMVPLLFMGEEWGSRRPFLFFTDYRDDLANAVREGRRNEFSEFTQFADAQTRQQIPDPNARTTFTKSQPDFALALRPRQQEWLAFYKDLLQVRRSRILPGLEQATSLGVEVLGYGAVLASWRLGNEQVLRIAVNLGSETVRLATMPPLAERLYAHRANDDEYRQGLLPRFSAVVTLELII